MVPDFRTSQRGAFFCCGKVLTIDGPTRNLSRTNVARACVEVDLLKDLPRQIWIGVGEGGFWQDLCYEKLPPYCTECRQQGHSTKACQANRSNSQSKTAKLKPSIKNPNSQIKEEGRSQEYFSRTKRVRISPIIDDKDDSNPITRQDLSQSQGKGKGKGKEVESTSERSLPLSLGGHSSGEQRAECSSAPTSEQVVLAEDPNQTDSEREDVPVTNNVALHTEVRWKGIGLQQRGSSHLVERKSPPRKMKPSSKRPIFFWKTKQKDFPVVELRPPTLMKYKYSEIKKMTKTFRDRIGQGGFGIVFKGTLLDGQEVAVKIGNERARDEEFSNEMDSIRDISHANVVRLLGFCSEGSKRALVYEFMPNGSLDKIIYSNESKSSYSVQRSQQLCKIAVGVARGLDFLQHGCHPPIVHFDVKPSNILLDKNLCPKLSDFGLARRWGFSGSMTVRGTYGYIPPELVSLGRFSKRTDVYSYGIMLLEMALRRKPINFDPHDSEEKFLVDWVFKNVTPQGGIPGFAWEATERKLIIVGLWCSQHDPESRPSFSTVVDMLEGSVDDLNVPSDNRVVYQSIEYAEYADYAHVDDNDPNVSCSSSSLVGR
ncbi:cysteine-rich receptor-like protein kinase 44 isoform X2 [Aristolochia californica]|uniref:cysteine-rich receptor-like protein kinase 44 isoform X2 n=1 Tax=Aristolochia californica TaxID=171875 RepID=UPI0035E185CF